MSELPPFFTEEEFMRLSLGETDQTDSTANVLADLGLDSEFENNDELDSIDVNLDTLLDEDYVSCTNVVGSLLAASGTGFDATEPEASPILPSGTGSNAYEPEVYSNQPSGTSFNATEPSTLSSPLALTAMPLSQMCSQS